MITIQLPIRTESEANLRQCWKAKMGRARGQRGTAFLGLFNHKVLLRSFKTYQIKLVRIAPRKLDSHDNLARSMKAVVDGIADILKIDDRSKRITWIYDQEKGKVREYAVRVEIKEAP